MWAYTGEAGIFKCNCYESVGGYSRAGGDRGFGDRGPSTDDLGAYEHCDVDHNLA